MKPVMYALVGIMTLSPVLAGCGNMHNPQSKSDMAPSSQTPSGDGVIGFVPTSNGQIAQSWLTQAESRWKPVTFSRIVFAPTFTGLSYDNPEAYPGNTEAVLQKELDMLESSGAQGITIDLGYDPWLSHNQTIINMDTHFIREIRASGKILFLKDASAERYRRFKLPWKQFEAAWVQRVKTIASLYHPEYYTVVKEPGWYAPMIAGLTRNVNSPADRQVLSVNTWVSLLKKLASAVKQVSPSTKVGISIPGDSLYHGKVPLYVPLMKAASQLSDINYLGFDIYDANSFNDTLRFLDTVGSHGKAVWINEAWSTTSRNVASNPQRSQLDVQWMKALYQFALYIHAQGVSPFYTDIFASYGPRPASSSSLLSYYSKRTPVYYEFVKVVAENKVGNTS